MTRTFQYIPSISGLYGSRIWVPVTDTEFLAFIKPICLWGGPTASRQVGETQEVLYELPIGTLGDPLWKLACTYFRVTLVQEK